MRALLIRYVVSHPSGFCSDVLAGWPSLLYPVLYPWASGAAGVTCIGLTAVFSARRQRRTPTN